MKKRVLAGLLTLCMLLALLPVAAFAVDGSAAAMDVTVVNPKPAKDGEAIAEVAGKKYDDLQDAIDAAKAGDTIKLLKDAELEEDVEVDVNNITIDFAGHTLILVAEKNAIEADGNIEGATISVAASTKVTMKNGNIIVDKAEDAKSSDPDVKVDNLIDSDGELVLEDMLLDATQSEDDGLTSTGVVLNAVDLTVKGKTQIIAVTDKDVEDANDTNDPDAAKAALPLAINASGTIEFDEKATSVVRGTADLSLASPVKIDAGTFDVVKVPDITAIISAGTFADVVFTDTDKTVAAFATEDVDAILEKAVDDDTAYTDKLYVFYQDADKAVKDAEAGDYLTTLNDGKQELSRNDYDKDEEYILDPIKGFHLIGDIKIMSKDGTTDYTDTNLAQNDDDDWVLTMPDDNIEITGRYKVCASADMKDVALDAWYHDYVDDAIDNDWMKGNGNGTFTPNQELTRAMLVQVLYNVASKDEDFKVPVDAENFADATGAWYSAAVLWAKDIGLAEGYGDNKFGPNDKLTREQMLTMLWRFDLLKKNTPAWDDVALDETDKEAKNNNKAASDWLYTNVVCEDFTDRADVSGYAARAFKWALTAVSGTGVEAEDQIIAGMTKTTLAPQGTATRAQLAKILSVYMGANGTVANAVLETGI